MTSSDVTFISNFTKKPSGGSRLEKWTEFTYSVSILFMNFMQGMHNETLIMVILWQEWGVVGLCCLACAHLLFSQYVETPGPSWNV
jgi:hypothetical protein